MQNPRLASRYAKSLLDISLEQNVLEEVLNDMELIQSICESNYDLVLMLRSPVIKSDKKGAVLNAILDGKVQNVTLAFIELMLRKGREYFMPEIASAFIKQYKDFKNIRQVRLTTAVSIDEDLTRLIQDKVAQSVKDGTIELNTEVDENLIGGFTLEVEDKLFDASIRRDLSDIKKQFSQNLYIPNI